MTRGLVFCCSLLLISSAAAAKDDHPDMARARIENGLVTVRWFMIPYVPLQQVGRPGALNRSIREALLQFNASDIRAFHPGGNAVDAATWQAALVKETAVLFLGHATGHATSKPLELKTVNLPAVQRNVYRKDALVLFGARSPVRQEGDVKGTKLPQGVSPHFGTVVLQADGMIHVTVSQGNHAHYPAPRVTGGETHIYQNSTTTVTRALPFADVRVWTPDGKSIAAASLPKWLTKEYPALVSGDGNEVDTGYLELMRPNTPIVAVPARPPVPDAAEPQPSPPPPK